MALVANLLTNKKHEPSDFNPYSKTNDVVINDLNLLKSFGFTAT
jgi:hypothetical protein